DDMALRRPHPERDMRPDKGTRLWMWLVLAFAALATPAMTCEPQDFQDVPEVLVVSSDEGRVVDRANPITHDRITRHIVDYSVRNESAEASEVVVVGTSYVNGVERASGIAVLALESGASTDGRLTDFELEYGDEIRLELQCCSASTCRPSEI